MPRHQLNVLSLFAHPMGYFFLYVLCIDFTSTVRSHNQIKLREKSDKKRLRNQKEKEIVRMYLFKLKYDKTLFISFLV